MLDDLDKQQKVIKCARCGKNKNTFGPPLELIEHNGKLYCDECLKIVELDDNVHGVSISTTTDSEKLTLLLKIADNIETESVLQSNYLKTIKTIMVVFTVLFVIGLIIQGCS